MSAFGAVPRLRSGSTGRIFFLADVHASPDAPERTERLDAFLGREVAPGDEVYVLGDLFDFWSGPHHPDRADAEAILTMLGGHVDSGRRITLLQGNRDFVAGEELERRTGIRLGGERRVLDLAGRTTLLLHGDQVFNRNPFYTAYRSVARTAAAQALFRALPGEVAYGLARGYRSASSSPACRAASLRGAGRSERPTPSDLPPAARAAVAEEARRARAHTVICGHVHREGRHELEGGVDVWTLGAWEDGPSWLRWDGKELGKP